MGKPSYALTLATSARRWSDP